MSFTTLNAPVPPAVVTEAPTGIGIGEATLNGTMTAGNFADTLIYWGDNDGMMTSSSWDHVVNLGLTTNGGFSTTVSGLLYGVKYYYRVFATNTQGGAWANTTTNFKTPEPGIRQSPENHAVRLRPK